VKILIVTQYFWPESFIINQLSTTLTTQGHDVTVLTGKPNYPKGEIYSGYHQQGILHEKMGDVEIIRVPLRPRKSGDAKALFLNYLSFIMSGLIRFPFLVKNRQFDVIFVFAPSPITSAIPAILLKYLKRAHLAIWVQDLWPASLLATGFIKNKWLLMGVERLVKAIYAASDTLLVQSKAFIEPVNALSSRKKILYFPNVMHNMTNDNSEIDSLPLSVKQDLDNYFCFVFAGNIGKAQSIETLIDAAEKLTVFTTIRIVIVGSDSMLDWVKAEVEKRAVKNIIFTGSFPVETMPALFKKAKALLVSLSNQEIFSYTIPSKVQAYMSAGRPIIASINGEAARVINEAQAGLTCPAENSERLATQLIRFFNMPETEHDVMANNSRQYFLENFEIQQQCEKMMDMLEQRIEAKRS